MASLLQYRQLNIVFFFFSVAFNNIQGLKNDISLCQTPYSFRNSSIYLQTHILEITFHPLCELKSFKKVFVVRKYEQ